jgi:hypothetical protein
VEIQLYTTMLSRSVFLFFKKFFILIKFT